MQVEQVYEKLLAQSGVVFLMGGIDTGKTTFAIELLRRATDAGIAAAFVDADVGQSTVGPPATVGLKLWTDGGRVVRSELHSADSLGFVGALSPQGHMVGLVTNTGKLVGRARRAGAQLVVVDTTGFVAGIHAQHLKFFKMDVVRPDYVVAFERGGDLDPLVGIARRFTAADVLEVEVAPDMPARSPDERLAFRERQFAGYFATRSSRWKVRPTVFMPTVPLEFDLSLLDHLLVGMEDGEGSCVGIGVLEYDAGEDFLRMVSPVDQGVRGLRLGSLKIDLEGHSLGSVDLRRLFGSE